MPPVARLGDTSSHGGHLITASADLTADGIAVARLGDLHTCPITGHGTTAMVTASVTFFDDAKGIVRVGDLAGCGAAIATGSPTTSAG
jgi:uncharacterized Zn-binding protein involved in type VI secretion